MKIQFNLKEFLLDKYSLIQRKNWIITVVIFFVVFIAAVIVWKDCVWNPQPTEDTLKNILNTEAEYKKKMEGIKSNYEELKERAEKFKNPQSNLREGKVYFEPSKAEIENNSSPKLVN